MVQMFDSYSPREQPEKKEPNLGLGNFGIMSELYRQSTQNEAAKKATEEQARLQMERIANARESTQGNFGNLGGEVNADIAKNGLKLASGDKLTVDSNTQEIKVGDKVLKIQGGDSYGSHFKITSMELQGNKIALSGQLDNGVAITENIPMTSLNLFPTTFTQVGQVFRFPLSQWNMNVDISYTSTLPQTSETEATAKTTPQLDSFPTQNETQKPSSGEDMSLIDLSKITHRQSLKDGVTLGSQKIILIPNEQTLYIGEKKFQFSGLDISDILITSERVIIKSDRMESSIDASTFRFIVQELLTTGEYSQSMGKNRTLQIKSADQAQPETQISATPTSPTTQVPQNLSQAVSETQAPQSLKDGITLANGQILRLEERGTPGFDWLKTPVLTIGGQIFQLSFPPNISLQDAFLQADNSLLLKVNYDQKPYPLNPIPHTTFEDILSNLIQGKGCKVGPVEIYKIS